MSVLFGSGNKPPVLPGEQESALVKIGSASYKQAEKKKPEIPYINSTPQFNPPSEEEILKFMEGEETNSTDELTVTDRISNTLIVMGVGLVVGGAVVATGGAVLVLSSVAAGGSVAALGIAAFDIGLYFMGPASGDLEEIELFP